MDDRAEFEQWAAERYEGQFRRNLDGDYCNVRLCEGWETWQAATARQRERDAQMVEEWKRLVSHTDYGAIPSKKSMLEVLIYVAACIRDSGKPAEAIRRQT